MFAFAKHWYIFCFFFFGCCFFFFFVQYQFSCTKWRTVEQWTVERDWPMQSILNVVFSWHKFFCDNFLHFNDSNRDFGEEKVRTRDLYWLGLYRTDHTHLYTWVVKDIAWLVEFFQVDLIFRAIKKLKPTFMIHLCPVNNLY